MSREAAEGHEEHAESLRARTTARGITAASLRAGALGRDAGGPPLPEPYDVLVRQVGADSARVTDAHVAAVREAAGLDKAAFEVILAASIGAGLRRWDAALRAIGGGGDAAG